MRYICPLNTINSLESDEILCWTWCMVRFPIVSRFSQIYFISDSSIFFFIFYHVHYALIVRLYATLSRALVLKTMYRVIVNY